MAFVKDIDLEDNLDLRIENGDFFVSESDQNHVMLILKSYIGAYKQFPLIGLGIDRFEAASISAQSLKREISIQLENDGYNVQDIKILGDYTYEINALRR
jgi:hypothetical protein